eukprot:Clim_evm98s172 gene=Clim_evmTU98s172
MLALCRRLAVFNEISPPTNARVYATKATKKKTTRKVHVGKGVKVKAAKPKEPAEKMLNVLNVAEKPSVATGCVSILAQGQQVSKHTGKSKYNPIAEFSSVFRGQPCNMYFTSVLGHMMGTEFKPGFGWRQVPPSALFSAPVEKQVAPDKMELAQQLKQWARRSDVLVIWTDCDREGENIGFEVLELCKSVKKSLQVFRANFSAVTQVEVNRAWSNLQKPNELLSLAADTRAELDLRLGAAFTRYLTLRYQQMFPSEDLSLMSYGSCQFPTLGFVADRHARIESFIPEDFWYILLKHKKDGMETKFEWSRGKLFEEPLAGALYEVCVQAQTAHIERVVAKNKSKWRPLPLTTVELQKLASKTLRISSHEVMAQAEALYNRGFLSYPRTETNTYPRSLNLAPLVEAQVGNSQWGSYAERVLRDGVNPRRGNKDDQAHPPIHPTKALDGTVSDLERKVYEVVTRHFLAGLGQDAKGAETIVTAKMATEEFKAKGLQILERNYLDVYPYDRWSDQVVGSYSQGEIFTPTMLTLERGATTPPQLLTESELIALMDKHGIGTDATIADHIKTVMDRNYVDKVNSRFEPTNRGLALYNGYERMQVDLMKPTLRAEMEESIAMVARGSEDKAEVVARYVREYESVYVRQEEKIQELDSELAGQFGLQSTPPEPVAMTFGTDDRNKISQCLECKSASMILKQVPSTGSWVVSCSGYPACRSKGHWLPRSTEHALVSDKQCPQCAAKMINLTLGDTGGLPVGFPRTGDFCIQDHDGALEGIRMCEPRAQQGVARSRSTSRGNSSRTRSGDHKGTAVSRSSMTSNRSNQKRAYSSSTFAIQDDNEPDSMLRPAQRQRSAPLEGDLCHCREPSVARTVQKEGPNKGRTFFVCGKRQGETRCDMFQWSDGRTSNGPVDKGSASTTDVCYKCQGTGHWAANCPNTGPSGSSDRSGGGGGNASSSDICYNCQGTGHWASNCPNAGQGGGGRLSQRSSGGNISYSSNHGRGGVSSTGSMTCYNCQQPGHFANNCPLEKTGGGRSAQARVPRSDMVCYKCNEPGHFANSCPSIDGGGGRKRRSGGRGSAEGSSGTQCYKCGNLGHWANACPNSL